MFENASMKLLGGWNKFFETILDLRKDFVKDGAALELLSSLDDDLTENSRVTIQIMLLPYLVPPRGRTLPKNKKHWKPSIIESQEGLVLHSKIPGDVEHLIEKKRNEKARDQLSILPYLVAVGCALKNIIVNVFL